MKIGYAISVAGDIDIKTVSPTPRGALVNFLATEREILITNSWTDERIRQAWDMLARPGEQLVMVEIRRITSAK